MELDNRKRTRPHGVNVDHYDIAEQSEHTEAQTETDTRLHTPHSLYNSTLYRHNASALNPATGPGYAPACVAEQQNVPYTDHGQVGPLYEYTAPQDAVRAHPNATVVSSKGDSSRSQADRASP